MKESANNINNKAKYYDLRKAVKELIFENSAYQNEITECQQKIVQRERERELLLQHLLQYEQEEWELQREMNNATTEKHKLIKKQQDADKRKRVKVDMHQAEATQITQGEEGTSQKIPKIKIVFQQKAAGSSGQEPAKIATVVDINSETKMAIKNKLKRNKVDPIVISLPTMLQNKDTALQQIVKRQRPNSILLPFNNFITSTLASSMMLSPSLAMPSASSHLISPASSLGLSPFGDMAESLSHTSDNTPIDVFSESENSCNVSPSNSSSDISHIADNPKGLPDAPTRADNPKRTDEKNTPVFDDSASRAIRINYNTYSYNQEETDAGSSLEAPRHCVPGASLASIRKPSEGFRISSSALRSIKQKIDSINANFDQAALKSASKSFNLKSPTITSSPKNLEKGDQN